MPIRRYVISGRVQGVGFRWFVVEEAQALGLRGHVRNLRDGQVEVVAEGPLSGLNDLEQVLRLGPRSARVTAVEVSDVQERVDLPAGFHITR